MRERQYRIDTAKKRHRRRAKIMRRMILLTGGSILCGIFIYAGLDRLNHTEKLTAEKEPQAKVQVQNDMAISTQPSPYGLGMCFSNNEKKDQEHEEEKEVFMQGFIDNRKPVWSKGIYLTASGAEKNIDRFIALLDSTELNSVVIDIKDDDGNITYSMDYQPAKDAKAVKHYISDLPALLSKLKEHNVYTIARVVTFKDPVLAKNRPDLALKKKDGSVFKDKDGQAWVNPYQTLVWEYVVGVAKECARVGFDEINFDYIRFSTDKGMSSVDYGQEAVGKTKIEAVSEFVKYACEQLKPMGVFVSADVYGAIIKSQIDAKIVGQSYVEMAKYLDYICPMIYPSHYGNGYYGIDYPDTQPYELIMGALKDSNEVLSANEGIPCAKVRPWLQDFTASWLSHYIKYGAEEVREQINAVYDSDYQGWLLWNGAMNYTKDALYTEETAKVKYQARQEAREKEEQPASAPQPTITIERLDANKRELVNDPWKQG